LEIRVGLTKPEGARFPDLRLRLEIFWAARISRATWRSRAGVDATGASVLEALGAFAALGAGAASLEGAAAGAGAGAEAVEAVFLAIL